MIESKFPELVPPDLLKTTMIPDGTGLLLMSLRVAVKVAAVPEEIVSELIVKVEFTETGVPGKT
ncbi:hypothetical protein D3C86_1741730 [compost metagenome]